MSVLTLLIVVLAAGILMYAINRASFISPPFKQIAMIILLVVIALLVLNAFGVIDALRGVNVPKLGAHGK